MNSFISKSLYQAKEVLDEFINSFPEENLLLAGKMIAQSLKKGQKVISCGNGGSLCDATHFAEELTGRYRANRQPYPAIAINDPAYITCVGNDYSFDDIFSRYVEGVGVAGDILLAISTSGESKNIIAAAQQAQSMGMKVIVLTSTGKNTLSSWADLVLASPKTQYSDRIQEIHIKIIHILIEIIELEMNN